MHFKYFSVKEIQNFLQENNLSINKKFGQNFLINAGVVDVMVRHADLSPDDLVIEIGCGLGSLTQKIIGQNPQFYGFEIDKAYITLLKKQFSNRENFNLIEGDFLKQIEDFTANHDLKAYKRVIIMGNLPYNITTPILEKIFSIPVHFNELYFMMQKEVAERIAAKEGNKKYGSLSVFCQYFTTPKIIINISPRSFYPAPKISSCVVKFERKNDLIPVTDKDFFFKVVRSLFINRRKQIKNNLIMSPILPEIDKEMASTALAAQNIEPSLRGEMLSIERIAGLANELYTLSQGS